MKAAIVHAFDQPPRHGEIDAPQAAAGEVLVRVRAAALSQLARTGQRQALQRRAERIVFTL